MIYKNSFVFHDDVTTTYFMVSSLLFPNHGSIIVTDIVNEIATLTTR